jgi:hypothetical protein
VGTRVGFGDDLRSGFTPSPFSPLSSDGPWEQLAGFRPVPSDEARIQVKTRLVARYLGRRWLLSLGWRKSFKRTGKVEYV